MTNETWLTVSAFGNMVFEFLEEFVESPFFLYFMACFMIAGAFELVRKIVEIGGGAD